MKAVVNTDQAPIPKAPLSQAIVVDNLIFTSGQIPTTVSGDLLRGTIDEQTHQVMKNLQAILSGAGATFADVVKTSIYITDLTLYGKVNEVYGSYMKEPYPARETVCVKDLVLGARVEISMIAVKPQGTPAPAA